MASQIGDIMSTSSVIVIVDDKQEEDEGVLVVFYLGSKPCACQTILFPAEKTNIYNY